MIGMMRNFGGMLFRGVTRGMRMTEDTGRNTVLLFMTLRQMCTLQLEALGVSYQRDEFTFRSLPGMLISAIVTGRAFAPQIRTRFQRLGADYFFFAEQGKVSADVFLSAGTGNLMNSQVCRWQVGIGLRVEDGDFTYLLRTVPMFVTE